MKKLTSKQFSNVAYFLAKYAMNQQFSDDGISKEDKEKIKQLKDKIINEAIKDGSARGMVRGAKIGGTTIGAGLGLLGGGVGALGGALMGRGVSYLTSSDGNPDDLYLNIMTGLGLGAGAITGGAIGGGIGYYKGAKIGAPIGTVVGGLLGERKAKKFIKKLSNDDLKEEIEKLRAQGSLKDLIK